MSLNQSGVEKSDAHIRKSGRSSVPGQQRSYHNANSGKGGAGGAASSVPLSPSLNYPLPSANIDRSLKKNNGQGGQSRVNNVAPSPEVHISRGVQNGVLPQNQQAVALVPGGPGVVKQPDHSTQKAAQTLSRPTSSTVRPPVSTSNSAPSGDSSKSFSFQFGTISPGFMNGIQIPARTSSAPPNLDEQKHDQALHDTRPTPVPPIVAAKQPLKQQQPPHPPLPQQQHQQVKKDPVVKIANVPEVHPASKIRRDASTPRIPVPPQSTAPKPSVHPLVGGSLSASFRQPQSPVPFNNPNTQPIQNVSTASIQMPLSLSGASVQPPVYVPNLQSHLLQAQGMIHQSQGPGYAPPMNPQLGPQLGSLGINLTPQFPQPPLNKFGGQRKAVKITDPKTHEELKLDKRADSLVASSSGQGAQLTRAQASVPPHSQQPINSFPSAHHISYYSPMQPNTYNPVYYAGQAPHPLPSGHIAAPGSSVPRHNYSVHHGGPTVSIATHVAQSASLPPTSSGAVIQVAPEHVNLEAVTGQLAFVQVTVKAPTSSIPGKVGSSTVSVESSSVNKDVIQSEPGKPSRHHVESGSVHLQRHTHGARLISAAMGEILAQLPASTLSTAVTGHVELDSHTQHLKHVSETASFSNSLHSVAKHSGTCSVSGEQSQASNVPLPDAILSDDPHALASVEGGHKWDPLKKFDSFKERQKHSIKERKHSEANQISKGVVNLKPSILVTANAGDTKSGPGSEVQESRQVGSEVLSPNLLVPSSFKLDNILPEVTVPEAKDGKMMPASVSNSDRVMEELGVICSSKVSEVVSSIVSDVVPVTVSVSERGHAEPSISLSSKSVRELISEGSVSSNPTTIEDCIPHNAGIAAGLGTSTGLEDEKRKMYCCSNSEKEESKLTSAGGADNSKSMDVIPHEMPVVNIACERVTTVLPKTLESEVTASEVAASTFVAHSVENLVTDFDKEEVSVESTTSQRCSNSIEPESLSSAQSLVNEYEKEIQHEPKVSGEKSISLQYANINKGLPSVPLSVSSEVAQKHETKVTESGNSGLTYTLLSSKDRTLAEHVKAKNVSGKKKKKKELLSKADAAGTTSDLYMAYKTSEQKREIDISENVDSPSSSIHDKQMPLGETENLSTAREEDSQSRSELDDWEEAAEIPSPKLNSLGGNEQTCRKKSTEDIDVGSISKKGYTRDFLMTFQDNCKDLPTGFEIGVDISDMVMSPHVNASLSVDRGGGRIYDRQPSGSRLDRRGGVNTEEDRWSKPTTPFTSARGDLTYGVGIGGLRPGQGGNSGVLKNPRGQMAGQYVGGILSGPMPSPGGSSRIMDADRWQRAVPVQKGLIPSPHTQAVVMHKAENKYEVGKVSDEEEGKQRQLKGILNKLTPQNFEKLFQKVKEVNIDNVVTLTGVISQIFDKALMEPTFCEMYADFCTRLAGALPDLVQDNEKITFRRLLLNKCQEEFERGEREQAEADKVVEGGEVKQSDGEREEKRIKARRRMLGNIRLIGELYKKKMLTERIMHECIKKLLGQVENPDEEDVESLCKLMSTIGVIIDHPVAKEHMDAYFDRIQTLSVNQKLSSRVRFMLKDTIDLRKNKWQQRRKIEGPKKIEEVHRDAAQERQSQSGRVSRGSGMNASSRRGQAIDYGPRGSSIIPSPVGQQTGSLRGLPTSNRFATQDIRMEDRHILENRAFSIPLPPRTSDDDSITLGPQGGLGKGMSMRGQPSPPGGFNSDSIGTGDLRRMPSGLNASNANAGADWVLNRPRDANSRGLLPDRPMSAPSYDQSNHQDVISGGSRGSSPGGHSTTDKLSEDKLREKSMSTIKEFYSANDEEEVASCMRDLNAPTFYPTMVSLWVTDSFERKAGERDRLTKLLIFLCKSRSGLLNQMQLIMGLESVFASLLDTIYDAPKAAEFLGGILGEVILENIITLREVARLICEGGEEPGSLTEAGIASDVLGSIFEVIKKEKGESTLNEVRKSSNFRLEDFLPPDPKRQGKLIAFV